MIPFQADSLRRMSASSSAPGAQQQRFAAYLDSLARAAGHLDRAVPLKSYCTGLLLPGERKSIEPMAARLAPDDVQRMHQSLHHFVANAPWSDEALLERVRQFVLPVMKRNGSVVAWIVDDTGFVKCFCQLDLAPFDRLIWPHPSVESSLCPRPERSPA